MSGTLEIVSPAPMLEARALYAGALKPWMQAAASLQMARAKTYGFVIDGVLVAVLGFWPLPDGREEVFLAARKNHEAGPHAARLALRARLIVARRLQCGVAGFVALVRIGHAPGARMARIVGLAKTREADGFEIWER